MKHDILLEPTGTIPDNAAPATQNETTALLYLGAGLFLGWACLFYIFGALLMVWEVETSFTKQQLSLGLTAAVFTSAMVAPVAGRVVDAGNSRLLFAWGALIGACGLIVLALSNTHAQFLFAWLFIGVAQGFCLYEPTFTFLARILRQRARRSIALVALVGGLSTILVYPAANWIADQYGWRISVLVFAALMGLVTCPLMYKGAAILEPSSCTLDQRLRRVLAREALIAAKKRPVFWILLLSCMLLAFIEGMVLAHSVPALVELGQQKDNALLGMALIGPFQALARVGLVLAGVRGAVLPLMTLSVLAMASSAWLVSTELAHESVSLGFAALFGIGYGVTAVLKPIAVSECLGYASIGKILGFMAFPYYCALAAAPFIGSLLWIYDGYGLVFQVAAIAAFCSAIGFQIVTFMHRKAVAAD
ncbi:MFS transporter [Roseovarius aestuariivivens]|uniref:MFS transporter n=1 Tax=Roseovarius aestuariivivens TaxID=1888910 RepID=UPI001436796F|nr:MFS transporter [Roseovarius aestuariivivens]